MFLTAAALAPAAAAQSSSQSSSAAPLFDGKSLAGWTIEEGPETAFFVDDGAIVVHSSADYPTWLRSAHEYENFDFRGEFFVKGWIDSGIYIHAPLHGRPTWEGIQVKIFHQVDEKPVSNSMGSLFPVLAPRKVNVRNEWNTFRIHMDWPRLQVWTNGEVVQDVDLEADPNFGHRLRRGYLGLASLSYPIRFRNLTIEELPAKEKWDHLMDMSRWYISEGKPRFDAVGGVIHADGVGHLATKDKYRDFELRMFVRACRSHNSGVLFRTDGKGLAARHYEIQLHDVEDAHFPTGSLYYYKRAIYPKIQPEKWYPFQLLVKDRACMVRINGDTVMEYDQLENLAEGSIELQAHRAGYWTQFKDIRIKRV